jgi:hypothetical protein
MHELERDLGALGRQIAYPPTPDLRRAVVARLGARPAARAPARPTTTRVLALSALALVTAAATAVAAPPVARDALLDLIDLRGVEIEPTSQPPPRPRPRPLDLGRAVTLDAAGDSLAFVPLVPRALGPPDRVFVGRSTPGGALSITYPAQPGLPRTRTTGVGLLLTEFRGDLSPEYLTKVVPQATRVERLRVGGDPAVWIAGAPHFFLYRKDGRPVFDQELEVAQNVLLLERGRLLVRLEGAFSKRKAIASAASMRRG